MSTRKNYTQKLFSFGQEAQKWNDLYEAGDDVQDHHFVLRRNAAYRYIAQHLSKDEKILDLGCGAGVFAEVAVANGYGIDCVDMSPDMLKLAGERLKGYNSKSYRLFNAESEKLPFPDNSYDAVVSLGMFGYLDDVDPALEEIHRVLKPGGMFLLSVRNRRNQYLFDPVRLPKKLFYNIPMKTARLAKQKLFHATSTDATGSSSPPSTTKKFMIDILDSPANLIKGVEKHRFSETGFIGIGYGPLMFNNKQIVSNRVAIRMSDFLGKLFSSLKIHGFTKWFADISIYIFEKSENS